MEKYGDSDSFFSYVGKYCNRLHLLTAKICKNHVYTQKMKIIVDLNHPFREISHMKQQLFLKKKCGCKTSISRKKTPHLCTNTLEMMAHRWPSRLVAAEEGTGPRENKLLCWSYPFSSINTKKEKKRWFFEKYVKHTNFCCWHWMETGSVSCFCCCPGTHQWSDQSERCHPRPWVRYPIVPRPWSSRFKQIQTAKTQEFGSKKGSPNQVHGPLMVMFSVADSIRRPSEVVAKTFERQKSTVEQHHGAFQPNYGTPESLCHPYHPVTLHSPLALPLESSAKIQTASTV